MIRQLLLVLWAGAAIAADPPRIEIPEMSALETQAVYVHERNRNQALTGLDYWGALGIEWGASMDTFQKQVKKKLLADFTDLKWEIKPTFDSSNTFRALAISLGRDLSNRQERLDQFWKIFEKLNLVYHAPSRWIKAPQKNRFGDSYVSGEAREYLAEWLGPETKLQFRLNDEGICLVYSQSPASKAAELSQARLAALKKEEQKAEILKNLARPKTK